MLEFDQVAGQESFSAAPREAAPDGAPVRLLDGRAGPLARGRRPAGPRRCPLLDLPGTHRRLGLRRLDGVAGLARALGLLGLASTLRRLGLRRQLRLTTATGGSPAGPGPRGGGPSRRGPCRRAG